MLLPYHTSVFALKQRTRLEKKDTLLVHAGASGVGLSAIQIGKAIGAHVLATAGSKAKIDFARAHGASDAFEYSDASWVGRVK